MKSSYKIAVLVAVAIFGFVVFHYATQSGDPEAVPSSEVNATPEASPGTTPESNPEPSPIASTNTPTSSPASWDRPTRDAYSRPAPTPPDTATGTDRSTSLMDLINQNREQAITSSPATGSIPGSLSESSPSGSSVSVSPAEDIATSTPGNETVSTSTNIISNNSDNTFPQPTILNLDTSPGTSRGTILTSGRDISRGSSSANTSTHTTPTTPVAVPPATTPTTAKTYAIQSGDTFSSIAVDLYGNEARWVDIAQANPLVDPTKLKVGQVIRLPSAGNESTTASGQGTATEPAIAPPGLTRTYTILPNDTRTGIAVEFYDDPNAWRFIYNANRRVLGDNPDRIPADVIITLPPRP